MTKLFDYSGVIQTLATHSNPEFWHVDHQSHPGAAWSIKTVIPKAEHADNDTVDTIRLYHHAAQSNFNIVKITDNAFNWNGDQLLHWDTVWVKKGWNLVFFTNENKELDYKITSASVVAKEMSICLIDSIAHQLAQLDSTQDREELLDLIESCEIVSSSQSEYESEKLRSKIKVVDD